MVSHSFSVLFLCEIIISVLSSRIEFIVSIILSSVFKSRELVDSSKITSKQPWTSPPTFITKALNLTIWNSTHTPKKNSPTMTVPGLPIYSRGPWRWTARTSSGCMYSRRAGRHRWMVPRQVSFTALLISRNGSLLSRARFLAFSVGVAISFGIF